MKLERLVLVPGILGLLVACADREADPGDPAERVTPAAAPQTEAQPDQDAFVRHMHLHTIHLDKMNAALAAGDLEAAGTPAYWLSRHEPIAGLPQGWVTHLAGMRVEGRAVEYAVDLASARAAAGRLADNCRGCHVAIGVEVDLSASPGG